MTAATGSQSHVQRKERNSARAGKGGLPKSNKQPLPGRVFFQQAEAAGKPCGQEYAGIGAGTDGLSYFPTQIPTKVLLPGALSLPPHLLQTFDDKDIHRSCCALL